MINEKCVDRLPRVPSALNPPSGRCTHNHTQIQEATVHVFAMTDRKGFKEWGESLRKNGKKHTGKLREKKQEKIMKNIKK